jgi:hypothetical protein
MKFILQKLSKNILIYFLDFLNIPDLFQILNTNKRYRNIILSTNKNLKLFLYASEVCKQDKNNDEISMIKYNFGYLDKLKMKLKSYIQNTYINENYSLSDKELHNITIHILLSRCKNKYLEINNISDRNYKNYLNILSPSNNSYKSFSAFKLETVGFKNTYLSLDVLDSFIAAINEN